MSAHAMPLEAEVFAPRYTALLAEDDHAIRMLLENLLGDLGYDVIATKDGQEALNKIIEYNTQLDVIVLDREMPFMNGVEVVRSLKQQPGLASIPVVMQTSAGQPAQVQEGIDAGVFYYLVKPVDKNVMHSVLDAAIREARLKRTLSAEVLRQRHAFELMQGCNFQYRTMKEAENVASFLANCYPDPDRAIGGLVELLFNAVEHGVLGIGYEGKTILINEGRLNEEIDRRLQLADFAAKHVDVAFKRKADGLYVQITDPGVGFDWRQYMRVNPARASDNHGRGIAQANLLSFDKLTYNTAGNQVLGVVNLGPKTRSW